MSQENTVVTVTEDQLIKSLTELEGKADEKKDEAAPVVVVEGLQKSATDTLTELGSEKLLKALDVSEVLDEAVALMGVHVDRSLEGLQKSVQGSAERDHAMIRVLGELKKSIDANTDVVKQLLAQPEGAAATRPVTVSTGEVLTKSATVTPAGKEETSPQALKKSILGGLETLVKSAGANTSDGARYSSALVKFETTGQISDADMQAALKAAK